MSNPEIDSAVQEVLGRYFEIGVHQSRAKRLAAATVWAYPKLVGTIKHSLPGTAAAWGGWAKQEPGFSRPPIPRDVALAAVFELCSRGLHIHGLLI